MTIVLTGGGSGGHITPILAVASELKRIQPDITLIYVGQTGDGLSDIPAAHPAFDGVHTVRAGKLRRYHGESIIKQLLDVKTTWLNIRDVAYVAIGLAQSYVFLRKVRPDTVFIKGGFVGVPVGLAAASLRIPYVTHDSDALPGLANRIIARWARLHAVGQPKEVYPYPASKTVTVGVPVQDEFVPVTPELQQRYRTELGIATTGPVLCVAGGGLGSHRVNQAVLRIVPDLFSAWPELSIVHQVGRQAEASMTDSYDQLLAPAERGRVTVLGYVNDMYRVSGSADVVVSRAGATNMAEFAQQAKACIIVPNPLLTGGHQTKNAQVLAAQQAVVVVNENQMVAQPQVLLTAITDLLQSQPRRAALAAAIGQLAHPTAAHDLAMLLLDDTNKTNIDGTTNSQTT